MAKYKQVIIRDSKFAVEFADKERSSVGKAAVSVTEISIEDKRVEFGGNLVACKARYTRNKAILE